MTPEALELKIKPRNLPGQENTQLRNEALLVRNALLQQGLETPMIDNGLSPQQKYDRIRELILDGASTTTVQEAAVEAGLSTLRENGLQAVFDGVTTVEELLRETIE